MTRDLSLKAAQPRLRRPSVRMLVHSGTPQFSEFQSEFGPFWLVQLTGHRLRGWNFYNPRGAGGAAFGATNGGVEGGVEGGVDLDVNNRGGVV